MALMIAVFSCKYSFIKAFSIICMYYEMIEILTNLTLDGADECCFVLQICFNMFYQSLLNCLYVLVPSQLSVCIMKLLIVYKIEH